MKLKKTVAALLACACILPMGALTACGETDGDETEEQNPPGVTTYTFEAEGVDLSEQSGRGWSNEASGCKMIQGQNTAKIRENATVSKSISNGYGRDPRIAARVGMGHSYRRSVGHESGSERREYRIYAV